MDFNLEELKLIAFWGSVAKGEMTLSEEHTALLEEINEYLKHWGD